MPDWPQSLVMFSYRLGPPEYTALIVLLLAGVVALAPGRLWKAVGMAVAGVLAGTFWNADPSAALQRGLSGLPGPVDQPLTGMVVLFGFLLPRIAQYAWRADRAATRWPRLLYNGLLMFDCLAPLLLVRLRWWPKPVAVALALAWAVGLGVYYGLGPADVPVCLAALAMGWVALRLDLPWPPAVYGMLFASTLSEHLLRSLLLSRGDWTTFVTRPICAGILVLAIALLVVSALVRRQRKRRGDDAWADELPAV